MPSELDWHHKIRDLLDDRIERRDVWLSLRVEADPAFPFDSFDDDEFVEWADDWIGFTVTSTAGPVMPGTAETEWIIGDNDELVVRLLLAKRTRRDGPLVGNPEPGPGNWVGE